MSGIAQQALLMVQNLPPVAVAFGGAASTWAFGSGPFSVSGVAVGAPTTANRLVVVSIAGVCVAPAGTFSSPTINGASAIIIGQNSALGGSDSSMSMLIAAFVSAGSSVTVGFSSSKACQGAIIGWGVSNLTTGIINSRSATLAAGGSTYSDNIGVLNGGAMICGASLATPATSFTATGMGIDLNGVILATGGVSYSYFGASELIGATNPTYPFSITKGASAGSMAGGIVTVSLR